MVCVHMYTSLYPPPHAWYKDIDRRYRKKTTKLNFELVQTNLDMGLVRG